MCVCVVENMSLLTNFTSAIIQTEFSINNHAELGKRTLGDVSQKGRAIWRRSKLL